MCVHCTFIIVAVKVNNFVVSGNMPLLKLPRELSPMAFITH